MLGVQTVVGDIIQLGVAAPVDDAELVAADRDGTIEVVDHDGVVAGTASDHGMLEQVLDVLNDSPGGKTVTGIGQLVGGVLADLEQASALTVHQCANHQLVVVQANIGIEGLAQRVGLVLVGLVDTAVAVVVHAVGIARAGVEELVVAQPAGDEVAAFAAVDDVIELRADQRISAVAAYQFQRSAIGGKGGRVDNVGTAQRLDDQRVALGTDAAGDHDLQVTSKARTVEHHTDTGQVTHSVIGHYQRIGIGAAEYLDDVRLVVVGDADTRPFHRLSGLRIVDDLDTGLSNPLPDVQLDQIQSRVLHISESELVRAAATIDHQGLDALAGDRTGRHTALQVGDLELVALQRVDQQVVVTR